MQTPMELARQTLAPDPGFIYAEEAALRFDQKRLASLVGFAAFGLPLIMGLGALITRTKLETSLSHFYYREVGLGDIFVGTLVFIGTLLLAYRGRNANVAKLASIAGVCAFGVAVLPTDGWRLAGQDAMTNADYWIGVAHKISAGGLFAILAVFCFFVFRIVEPRHQDGSGECLATKARRNRIYTVSGSVIVAMMLAILLGTQLFDERWDDNKLTFWCESAALIAFGFSWITVGRAMNSVLLDPQDKQDRATVERREATAERAKPF